MASTKGYLDYVLDLLSELDGVRYRSMMGKYILYYRNKVIGGVYDDRFLLKPTRAGEAAFPGAAREIPYDGAREMLAVDCEDRRVLAALVVAMADELPAPKSKRGAKDV